MIFSILNCFVNTVVQILPYCGIMFTVGNIDRYIGRHSIDLAVASRSTVDRVSVDIAVDAPRPNIGHMSVVYRSTVGDMSVNCRWHIGQLSVAYRSTVPYCVPGHE